ncbi:hypothetical protein ACLQ16_04255 [Streptomyces albidoflavus]|uniref:hypothetical protein n=1 Tax=Streptomyces albidoflavus TaxID=1886 RepID=UPI000A1CB92F|nr:hypothetical protein [Streptomyces albidoflavus]
MPAISLAAMHALALYAPFTARVRMAWTYIARQVLTEDPETPGNPLRVSLARTVLNPADLTVSSSAGLTPVIATCDTIITAAATAGSQEPAALCDAITDDDLLSAVKDAWNITAGVPRDLLSTA